MKSLFIILLLMITLLGCNTPILEKKNTIISPDNIKEEEPIIIPIENCQYNIKDKNDEILLSIRSYDISNLENHLNNSSTYPVPEPTTLILVGFGIMFLVRRKHTDKIERN